jgi:hypothetical protein
MTLAQRCRFIARDFFLEIMIGGCGPLSFLIFWIPPGPLC